jgi:hypothetical protein
LTETARVCSGKAGHFLREKVFNREVYHLDGEKLQFPALKLLFCPRQTRQLRYGRATAKNSMKHPDVFSPSCPIKGGLVRASEIGSHGSLKGITADPEDARFLREPRFFGRGFRARRPLPPTTRGRPARPLPALRDLRHGRQRVVRGGGCSAEVHYFPGGRGGRGARSATRPGQLFSAHRTRVGPAVAGRWTSTRTFPLVTLVSHKKSALTHGQA